MKKRYESQRGAILVESALVVGAIFLMLFGTVFISIVGFDQMSADGASFEAAHEVSVGASAAPNTIAHNTYPNIPAAQITTLIAPAPMQSIAVNYGYNDPSSAVASASAGDRHGGVAMMQGTQVQGNVSKSSATIAGSKIGVLGGMVEPMWLENGVHFDAKNSNSFGGTTPNCSATATPAASPAASPAAAATAPPCFQGSVFTAGENTPPYYIGFNILTHCADSIPYANSYNSSSQSICTLGTENFIALGVAEFLDHDNWAVTTPGLSGSAASSSTFALAACHQRVYATIASFFAGHPTLQGIYDGNGGSLTSSYATSGGPGFYYYRALAAGDGSSSFVDWAGYDTTASNEGSGTTNKFQINTGPTDTAIREVYGWDSQPFSQNGGTLSPANGC